MCMDVHSQFLKYIRNKCIELNHPMNTMLLGNDNDVLRQLFLNYREHCGVSKGLRLSNIGLMFAKLNFDNWTINLDGNFKVRPKHVIFLDRYSTMPYHLFGTDLILFDKQFALTLKLIGDLDAFIEMELENKPSLKNKRA